jgi:hypothetical protein
MMPKSVKRFSDDIMLYLFDLETDSDFRSTRPEIIRLWGTAPLGQSMGPLSSISAAISNKPGIADAFAVWAMPSREPAACLHFEKTPMGLNHYFLDPTDPFPEGYLMNDTWGVTGIAEQ